MSSPSISTAQNVRVLVVGLGTMGTSHARAYRSVEGFELVGLCTSRAADRDDLEAEFPALKQHAGGRAAGRQRCTSAWSRFVEIGRTLGKPLVMRMNLNQQSTGSFWEVHKNLMRSTSPIVDCGVHYVDIMCQVTRARPVAVHAVGARLTSEIAPAMYNYGHLHIMFDDGSVGWYEVGWGPMMSETAHFVKDLIGPNGRVSIVAKESTEAGAHSADHDTHTRTNALRIHHAARVTEGRFAKPDELIPTTDEPGHQEPCEREQRLFLSAIRGEIDLSEHHEDAINSLRIVFAADESVRSGEVVRL